MPVLIDEVIAEISDVTPPAEGDSYAQQIPLTPAETELMQTLNLIRQRLDRLKVD